MLSYESRSIYTMSDSRLEQLHQWAEQSLQYAVDITPVSGDASFRRYFRVTAKDQTQASTDWIAMDAPPDKEDSQPFVDIAQQLAAKLVHVPHIQALDLAQGFMLLEDLGDIQLLHVLNNNDQPDLNAAEQHYGDALRALLHLQTHVDGSQLPAYNRELLSREMSLFTDWFLGTHLRISLSNTEQQRLQLCMNALIASALEQPNVFVHRDYHSRNLMVVKENSPGIIDFQDAVYGPITYDLVSLLRDCYIAWPDTAVQQWVSNYHKNAVLNGLTNCDAETFHRWFDFMGVQRHMKAIGIFARLNHRDGKSSYLNDIPRTLTYVETVCDRYETLKPLGELITRLDVRRRLEASLHND